MSEIYMKNIQWFPGHMTKTRRMICSNISLVDAVVEILDARIPLSSKNPDINRFVGDKPKIMLLNKSGMADQSATSKWISYYEKRGYTTLAIDCKTGYGVKNFIPTVREKVLASLLEKRNNSGMTGAPIRLMILGIPNVGKSSFINCIAQSKKAKVEDRPGVTRTKQWVKIDTNMELLDMPGVLWPKFDDQNVARNLAFTGAINDNIMDLESLAMLLLESLARKYPEAVQERYKVDLSKKKDGFELLTEIGLHRGMLIRGGEVNYERAAIMVFDEFRGGKLGKLTLELPEE
ncbi:MAG: ribosome biogenesis GTPase YlqF [Ruminococcus sp.]|nr:ribosome biogenesis GTPase YlqF [Ruminococcus sp.]